MGKIIISFFILFAALTVKAQSVSGVRIDGGNGPILVYFGGSQMCLPSTSCFVANLRSGYYTVEIYASRYSRPGERLWKGQKLYSQRVYFKGTGVMDIYVDGGSDVHPGDRPSHDDYYSGYGPEYDAMNPNLFETFYRDMLNQASAADCIRMVEAAVVSSNFTSEQCLRLADILKYDNDKMIIMRLMYPRIVDKEAFFTLIGSLKYTENKDKMAEFVRNYDASGQE